MNGRAQSLCPSIGIDNNDCAKPIRVFAKDHDKCPLICNIYADDFRAYFLSVVRQVISLSIFYFYSFTHLWFFFFNVLTFL